MLDEEQSADNHEASMDISSTADTEQPGIDYTVDFIYGSDQSQYVQQQDADEIE